MFKLLKDKLSNWKDKLKKEFSPEEEPKKKTQKKKEIKKDSKNKTKASQKIKPEKKTKTSTNKKNKEEIYKEIKEEVIEDIQEETIEEPQEKKSFFDRFKKKITEEKFEELFQELEIALLQNNVAYDVVQKIKSSLSEKLIGKNLSEDSIEDALKESIEEILIEPPKVIQEIKNSLKKKTPYVIVFAGINGSGKTTTIAKVANMLKKEKLSVCLAAADTYRAAAIDQLKYHAEKLNVPFIAKDYGSDPAAVGFDAISYAKKNKIDVVLIDTAGRLQNKDSLMKEIEKISRVCNPNLKLFVGESITGNDATEQAKSFNETIQLDGIVLSKADVDEKGGTALSVSHVTQKPIYFIGTGQTYDDIEVFKKKRVLDNLGLS